MVKPRSSSSSTSCSSKSQSRSSSSSSSLKTNDIIEYCSSCTSSSNSNSSSSSSSSIYRGVRKRKWGKYVSEIRLPNSRERIWLGSYDTPEKAARAFDAALFCLRGKSAKFNFPTNPPEIEGGESLTPLEIQSVAAKFANEDEQLLVPNKVQFTRSPSSLSSSTSSGGGYSFSSVPSVSNTTTTTTDDHGLVSPIHHDGNDLTMDWSFLDLLSVVPESAAGNSTTTTSSVSDFGDVFTGLMDDDFPIDFLLPQPAPDQATEYYYDQQSFLWNF